MSLPREKWQASNVQNGDPRDFPDYLIGRGDDDARTEYIPEILCRRVL
jgi:hypothetical protein